MATITGDKALDRKLAALSTSGSRRARRAAVRSGMTEVARGIRSEVPVSSGGRDKAGRFTAGGTKGLKKSIGSRVAKAKRGAAKGTTQAKAGVNVGKKSGKRAPHAHLVALGTGPRATKDGQNRGIMPASNFVERGFNKSAASAKTKMLSRLAKAIDKEAKKAASKK